jgi:hypothetical protein
MARLEFIAFSGENVCKEAIRGVGHVINGFISYTMSLAHARAEAAKRLERIGIVLLIDTMTLSLPPKALGDGI